MPSRHSTNLKLEEVRFGHTHDEGDDLTMQAQIAGTYRILRHRDVQAKIGVARSTIYDWINPKSPRFDVAFPKPVRIGLNSVGWLESEIDNWIIAKRQDKING